MENETFYRDGAPYNNTDWINLHCVLLSLGPFISFSCQFSNREKGSQVKYNVYDKVQAASRARLGAQEIPIVYIHVNEVSLTQFCLIMLVKPSKHVCLSTAFYVCQKGFITLLIIKISNIHIIINIHIHSGFPCKALLSCFSFISCLPYKILFFSQLKIV